MKKKLCLALSGVLCLSAGVGCGTETAEETLTPVRLNEVVHSVFYAPQYVAQELGFFEEEGLDVSVAVGNGADKSMTALLSDSADIALLGTEAGLYVYAEGKADYPKTFAQLTQRAGNFLVSREKEPDFQWSDLEGKSVIGGRLGGMPEMVFEYILKKNNLDPATDLSIDQSIDFGSTAAAFSGGQGDYTVEFEPSATALEQEGSGYVVASLGVDSGYVPYTAYCAKSSYLKESPQIIQGFTNALQKGMDYVHAHTPAEIAQVIKPQFDDTDMETLTAIVKRYQEQDTWKDSLIFEKDSFLLLSDILESAGELSEKVPYEQLVTTDFAKKAASH